jgi:hypothetical protein
MRNSILLAVAMVMVICARGWAEGPPPPGEKETAKAAKDVLNRLTALVTRDNPLVVRLSALDALSQLGAKEPDVVKALQEWLKDPPGKPEQKEFVRPYVIQALARVGAPAVAALPDLLEIKGRDSTLDTAIDAAAQAIAKPPGARPIKDLQPDLKAALNPKQPSADYVDGLAAIVADATNGAALRLMAAKALGAAGKNARSAVKALEDIAKEDGVDEDLKAMADKAAKLIKAARD